jgi:hypothetical protein
MQHFQPQMEVKGLLILFLLACLTRPFLAASSSDASLVYIPWLPKFDAVLNLHMVLEIIHIVENETSRCAHRMGTNDLLFYWLMFQMNPFHVVHHV